MDLGNLLGRTVVSGVTTAVAAFGKTFTPPPGGFSKALTDGLPIPGNVAKGTAEVGGEETAGAKEVITAAQVLAGRLKFQSGSKFNPNRKGLPNPLEGFASYTTVFTFACLKKEEVNNPYIYRNNDFVEKQVVFSSAGRYDKERVPVAMTRYGAPEYYVDNLFINSTIAPNQGTGASNAHEITFDIYEPYSVGLFLQSLNTAALYSGYPNYLTDCPYVLKMEFLGYEEDGTIYSGAQPKFFVMTLNKCDFTVTESGSNYKVTATPYNLGGFTEVMSQTFNDISLTGSTVEELLVKSDRSLQKALNDIAQKAAKGDAKVVEIADRYEIHFPESANSPIPGVEDTEGNNSATVNATENSSNYNIRIKSASNAQNDTNFDSNPIGKASFGFKADSGGNYVSPRAQDVYDSATGLVNRDNVSINPKTRTFQFGQGQSVIAMISQAILSSDYATKALKAEGDANGRVDWFRIDCQIQLTDYDTKRGSYAKRIIYRVMPYKVHKSVFGSPESVPDYGTLQEELIKQYDYIYTGQNNDIIKFDITLDTAFYTAISPTPPADAGRSKNQDTQSSGEEERTAAGQSDGANGVKAQVAATGSPTVKRDPEAIKLPSGGSGQIDPEYLVAQNFQQAFLDNGQANLVNVRLEILGDPYWLTDNGIGGYLPGPGETEMITEDGSANYEMGDIYIWIRLRTPLDVDAEGSGMYDFSNGSVDSPFSGIYKVTRVESKFSGGTFTQGLECLRMPKQPGDFASPVTPDNKPLYDLNKKEPADNGVLEDNDSLDEGTLLAGEFDTSEGSTEITYDV